MSERDEHLDTGTGWPERSRPHPGEPQPAELAEPEPEPAELAEPEPPVAELAEPEPPVAELAEPAPEPAGAAAPQPVGEGAQPQPVEAAQPPPEEAPEPQPVEAAEPEPSALEADFYDLGDDEPAEPEAADLDKTAPGTTDDVPRRRRISAAGAAIGVLLVLLGFAFVIQLRSHATDPQLAAARPEDLVRILSDLDARKDRLTQEIGQLETTQQQLAAGSQGRSAALAAAEKRAQDLGILAGTLPAQGTGILVRLVPGGQGLKSGLVLDTVEELRDAGAEAMQIDGANGVSVRVVASTWFADGPGGALSVEGHILSGPYTISAIGDPQTMQTALNIPGGVVDTVHNAGGNVIVNQPGLVRVTTLHQTEAPRYARPAS
jgi:uncharacterized protein YlxW (UPF0749 family)